jgi:hypothetical protein
MLPQVKRILQESVKRAEIMDMEEEIIDYATDDAMEDKRVEEARYLFSC